MNLAKKIWINFLNDYISYKTDEKQVNLFSYLLFLIK